jgi:hypothetical protein
MGWRSEVYLGLARCCSMLRALNPPYGPFAGKIISVVLAWA